MCVNDRNLTADVVGEDQRVPPTEHISVRNVQSDLAGPLRLVEEIYVWVIQHQPNLLDASARVNFCPYTSAWYDSCITVGLTAMAFSAERFSRRSLIWLCSS